MSALNVNENSLTNYLLHKDYLLQRIQFKDTEQLNSKSTLTHHEVILLSRSLHCMTAHLLRSFKQSISIILVKHIFQ